MRAGRACTENESKSGERTEKDREGDRMREIEREGGSDRATERQARMPSMSTESERE